MNKTTPEELITEAIADIEQKTMAILDPTNNQNSKLNIFQIYYNKSTRKTLQPQFIPLDNTKNSRPDWAEYWPIRQYFIENDVIENDWYGFLSPRFTEKTGLTDIQAIEFMDLYKDTDYDVIIFSPFWALTAFYKNPFEQGEIGHPKLVETTQRFIEKIGGKLDIANFVTHSQNTVWCNYIVAKPKFWLRWFTITNALFEIAENPKHELYSAINGLTAYKSGNLSLKIFMMERLATVLLATEPWRVKAFDTFKLPASPTKIKSELVRNELIACDALKRKYSETGDQTYLDTFLNDRNVILEKLKSK